MDSLDALDLRWKIRGRHEVSRHGVFRIEEVAARHITSGNDTIFSVINCPDWVNVICFTPRDEVVLVRQYRAGVDAVTLELPGGVVNPGEPPLVAAQRELREETGYEARDWRKLGTMAPNPAFQSNACHVWLATQVSAQRAQCTDPDERIAVTTEPFAGIPELILRGEITHALVLGAFQLHGLCAKSQRRWSRDG
jgi:ADP-ribose pyrophosphatase